MEKKYYLLIISVIVLFGCSSNQMLQARDLDIKIENSENLNSYQRDFIYLTQVLEDSHPNIYENFPKEEFDVEKENLLTEFQNLNNETVFQIKLQKFVAKIGDAHTKVSLGNLYKTKLNYPVRYRWIKEKLYIIDTDKSLSDELIGSQVTRMNDLSIKEVVELGGSVISCENEIWKKSELRDLFRNPNFLNLLRINDSIDSLKLTINTKNIEKEIFIYTTEKVKWRNPLAKHNVTNKRQNFHSYKIFPEEKTCYYQFNVFMDRNIAKYYVKNHYKWYMRPFINILVNFIHPNYSKFLKKMFKEMKDNNVEKIIVDLRYNGGGNSALGNLFMYYCDIPKNIRGNLVSRIKLSVLLKNANESEFNSFKQDYLERNSDQDFELPILLEKKRNKFNEDYSIFKNIENGNSYWKIKPVEEKFSGKIILLIGSETFSSASDFAAVLGDNELATLIGEPIGQKPTSFGDKLNFYLPETKTRVSVSFKYFQRPDPLKDNEPTLYPDIEIYPTIDEILNGKDPVFEKAMKL